MLYVPSAPDRVLEFANGRKHRAPKPVINPGGPSSNSSNNACRDESDTGKSCAGAARSAVALRAPERCQCILVDVPHVRAYNAAQTWSFGIRLIAHPSTSVTRCVTHTRHSREHSLSRIQRQRIEAYLSRSGAGQHFQEVGPMSQILLPPSSQEPQPPAVAAPEYTAPPPPYTPEPLKRPSRFWRAIKWPIRQALKGIYLLGAAVNRHRIISLIVLAAIAAMVAGGVLTYRALNPESGQASGNTAGSGNVTIPDTPFTVVTGTQVAPSNGVLLWLHGTKTYNAQELWNGMSKQYQNTYQASGSSQADLQKTLDGWRSEGLKFDQYIVAGSYQFPDGSTTYTVEVVVHENAQQGIFTWYFKTNSSGQILSFRDLTQG